MVAPEPGEKGEAYAKLAKEGQKLGEGMKDALAWTAGGGVWQSETVSAGDHSASAALWAIGEGWLEVYPRFLTQGRRIGESELQDGARVAMLDEGLAFKLFGEELPPDATVTVSCALKDAMSASVTVSDSPDATTRSSAPAVAAHAAARKSTDRCLLIAFVSFSSCPGCDFSGGTG